MKPITKRLVLHFPGFEPVDAASHRNRYERASRQSGSAFGFSVATGAQEASPFPVFQVEAKGPNWSVDTKVAILDHNDYITALRAPSFLKQVWLGYLAAFNVLIEGGLTGYLKQAWRFGLFFVFPFLLMTACLVLSGIVAILPFVLGQSLWHMVWTLPLAMLMFWKGLLPFAERYLTLHLFADWRMALAVARQNDPSLEDWFDSAVLRVRQLLQDETYDEVLVTGHSMGASLSADVLGRLLQVDPDIFKGKSVAFVTLGGAILQCALLKSASHLRQKVSVIAQCQEIDWTEVQCLTDIVHFYKTKTVAACGFPHLRQANLLLIRFKRMLSPEHYRKIKKDTLRVHRQYVLASDIRSNFDFALLTAGPVPASVLATCSEVAKLPVAADGTLI